MRLTHLPKTKKKTKKKLRTSRKEEERSRDKRSRINSARSKMGSRLRRSRFTRVVLAALNLARRKGLRIFPGCRPAFD